jgi:hypothetical protein
MEGMNDLRASSKWIMETIVDLPEFTATRVGNWIMTQDHETGETEWEWYPDLPPARVVAPGPRDPVAHEEFLKLTEGVV